MTTVAAHPRYTPDDVLRLENEGLYELVDGQLVEKPMSSLASETAGIVGGHLFLFLRQSRAGKVYPEQSFRCFPHDPDLIRRPDIAVVVASRLPGVSAEGHVTIAPDMAIEVISPHDLAYDIDDKLADYRSAGIKLVWVLNPKRRILRIHGVGGSLIELTKDDERVTAEPVLPGFSVTLQDLLPPRDQS